MDQYTYMNNIRIYTLFSSSSGNCHYLRLGENELLIDAGKNAKAVCAALSSIGTDIKNIRSIYVTHEHSDHTSALRVLRKKNAGMTLHMHPLCADAMADSGIDMAGCVRISEGETLDEDGVRIRAFGVCHDSRACLGYRIEYTEGDESVRIGIATDIGHLTCEVAEGLLGCDYVIVESNHDPEMLKTGPYPDYLKVRIFSPSGHLQNESCAKLCSYLSKLGTHGIMLAHISKENNDPALALKLTEDAVANGAVTVRCARPDTPVCLYESNNCTERLSECSR